MDTNKTNVDWGQMDAELILKTLEPMHRSRVYLIIRDEFTLDVVKKFSEPVELKQKFQDLKMEAKKSWDHDHKTATMEDVDRACTVVYTTLLQLLRASHEGTNDLLGKVCEAINNLEVKLGMEQTDWSNSNDDVKGDTAGNN